MPSRLDLSYWSTVISCFLLLICVRSAFTRPEEGEVRLVGGSSPIEGNLQIYHNSRWGSICDDGWDLRDATVVCRQLGYARSDFATTASRFGLALRQIWLANVQCWGYERNITTCRSDGWGSGGECDSNEAAGVICKSSEVQRRLPRNRAMSGNRTVSPAFVISHMRRAMTTAHPLTTDIPRVSRTIPTTTTTTATTTSTSTRLMRRSWTNATTTTTTTVHPTPMLIEDFQADEASSFQIERNAVQVYLEKDKRRPVQVRLAGGRNNREGRVEVRFEGASATSLSASDPYSSPFHHSDHGGDSEWGVICGNGWSLKEADVICRQLGLGQGARAIQNVIFTGPQRAIVLSGVTCTGQEASIMECFHKQIGAAECHGHRESIAGVMCNTELPDLVVDMEFLVSSVYLQDQPMFYLTCAMEENCLSSSAYELDKTAFKFPWITRRLLRFTLATKNIGKADFVSFIPKHLWQWHACHKHYHSMEVFAHFDILDAAGKKVAEGHKASFCLEDNACDNEWQKKYNCANFGDQGISVGCFDIYKHDVDCQWIDLTDIKPGVYTFKVTVNPDTKVAEMRYDNNVVMCKLYYYDSTAYFDECKLIGSSSIAVGLSRG